MSLTPTTQVKSESVAHAEGEETGRQIIQILKDDVDNAAERIKFLTRTAAFQLPLFLQIIPESEYLSSLNDYT